MRKIPMAQSRPIPPAAEPITSSISSGTNSCRRLNGATALRPIRFSLDIRSAGSWRFTFLLLDPICFRPTSQRVPACGGTTNAPCTKRKASLPLMLNSFDAMQKTLADKTPKDFHWKSAVYPDEDHGSSALRGYYDGLREIFLDWHVPTDQDGKIIGGFQGLEAHYRELSARYGYEIRPA